MSRNTTSGMTLAVAACAVLAFVAAAATTGGAQNTNSGATANDNTHAGHGAAMMADHKFAMMAAMGGTMEVEMGRLAAQKGASDEVRQFGQRMVDDHTKANEELMQLASGKGMTLPAAPDPKHRSEMQKLSALSGERFDREYVKMMVKDHRKDGGEFQKEAARGADPELKSFASRTLPTLQEHLQMIQRINDKMAMRKSGNLKTTNSNSGGNTNSNGGSNTNNSNM
jgi:putative membrane protein